MVQLISENADEAKDFKQHCPHEPASILLHVFVMLFLASERDLGFNLHVLGTFSNCFKMVPNDCHVLIVCHLRDLVLKWILRFTPYYALISNEIVLNGVFFSFKRMQCHRNALVEIIFKIPEDERILSWYGSVE